MRNAEIILREATNIIPQSCFRGLHSNAMRDKPRQCWPLQNHVWIQNFAKKKWKMKRKQNKIATWSYCMEGRAKKCVERKWEVANNTTQRQVEEVSIPCVDDHQLKEEFKSVWESSHFHFTSEYKQHLGLFQHSDFAGDFEVSKSTSGGTLCKFGSRTLVLVSWMCKKQTCVSRSSTELEIISLNETSRMDGIPAHNLWDLFFDVLHLKSNRKQHFKHGRKDPSHCETSQHHCRAVINSHGVGESKHFLFVFIIRLLNAQDCS